MILVVHGWRPVKGEPQRPFSSTQMMITRTSQIKTTQSLVEDHRVGLWRCQICYLLGSLSCSAMILDVAALLDVCRLIGMDWDLQ